jgi:hypothetical protein
VRRPRRRRSLRVGGRAGPQIDYLSTMYLLTPRPLGQIKDFVKPTRLVVVGTMTALHAAAIVGKKAPVQTYPLQTPAPTLA